MRSPSNDTSRDITSLLSPESRTRETEELVRVLSQVRPQIFIDRTYQKELRSRLIATKTSKKYIFSLPLWTGILSTAFAALL
jgi:phosphohistidine phosphatase SixA